MDHLNGTIEFFMKSGLRMYQDRLVGLLSSDKGVSFLGIAWAPNKILN